MGINYIKYHWELASYWTDAAKHYMYINRYWSVQLESTLALTWALFKLKRIRKPGIWRCKTRNTKKIIISYNAT